MSNPSDLMEIKEELIREKYTAAESLLDGFDHTPRLAKAKDAAPAKNCLLYTSPSPRDRQKSRMPSSA